MGCACCSFSSFTSVLLQALERISLCTVCAMLTCCLMATILTVLGLGIGIGFHYCTVQHAVEGMEKAAEVASGVGQRRSGGPAYMRSLDKAVKRGFAHRLTRRELQQDVPSNNNTINNILGNQTEEKDATFWQKHATFGNQISSLLSLDNQAPHRPKKRNIEQDMIFYNNTNNYTQIGLHSSFEKSFFPGNVAKIINKTVFGA